MAKSIRSKRKRKLRAERREKLKPRLKERLEKILGVNDKETLMEVEGSDGEKLEGGRQEVLNSKVATGSTSKEAKTDIADDVVMKSEDTGGQKKFGKKALKRTNKRNSLKRLGNKKRKNQKIFKW